MNDTRTPPTPPDDLPEDFDAKLEAIDEAVAGEGTPPEEDLQDSQLARAQEMLDLIERVRRQPLAETDAAAFPGPEASHEQTFVPGSGTPEVETGGDAVDADWRTTRIGDYEFLGEIARGGMGMVLRARHRELDRVVALKMMLAGPFAYEEEKQRFRVEAEAAAQLDHPGIVPVYDVGEHQGQPYFTMGFVDGESLSARIQREPLEPRAAATLSLQIADAVAYAHERGVIHRDIKPLNVLLDRDGRPRITDFGLARRTDSGSELTGTGQVLGTPSYMSPEQAAGKTDCDGRLADVYAIGGTLYCMLTGRPPFQAANAVDTLRLVIEQEPVSPRQLNPGIPVDLATICLKCLQKEPQRRYESAAELSADLQRFLNREPIHARPVGRLERVLKWSRRHPLVAGLSATVAASLLALLVGGAWYQSQLSTSLAETETERARTTNVLYESLTEQAWFLNQVRPAGFGEQVWEMVDQARQLDTPARDVEQLRQLAVGSLGSLTFERPRRFEDLGSQVFVADVTPDDRFLFVGLEDGHVVIFDLINGREAHRFPAHQEPVAAIRVLGNDCVVTLAPFCREALIWRRGDDGGWSLDGPLDLAQTDACYDLVLGPNARYVIGWSGHAPGSIETAMVPWPERITTFQYTDAAPEGGAESWMVLRPVAIPSKRPIGDQQEDAPPRIIDTGIPGSHMFDLNETHLLVCFHWGMSDENVIVVYNLAEQRIERRIEPACGTLDAAIISRDGRFVAANGHLGVEIFDRATGETLARPTDLGLCGVVQFVGDDGDVLLFNWHATLLYSTREQRVIARLPAMAPGSNTRIATSGRHWLRSDGDAIETARLMPVDSVSIAAHATNLSDASFSPDGRIIATSGENEPVRLWDADSGRLIREIPGSTIAFHPDGNMIAVHFANRLDLWSLPDGRLLASAPAAMPLSRIRFNRRGDGIAGIFWSEASAIWRVTRPGAETEARIEPVTPHNEGGIAFAWSPSGRRLALCTKDIHIRIIDFDNPERQFELEHDFEGIGFRSLVFLSEERLGVTQREFQVWDVTTRERVATHTELRGHRAVDVSANRRFLTLDTTILDARTMQPVLKLPAPELACWCSAWSPDGRRFACGFDGGRLTVWNLDSVHDRLATIDLAWESPEFGKRQRLDSVTELLAGDGSAQSTGETGSGETGDQAQTWGQRVEDVFERVDRGATAAEMNGDVDWLLETLEPTAESHVPFRAAIPLDQRIRRLVKFAVDLRPHEPELSGRILTHLLSFIDSREQPDVPLRLSLASVLHALGDLYNFRSPPDDSAAIDAYDREQTLVDSLLDAEAITPQDWPATQVFWSLHNQGLALIRRGDRAAAIDRLEAALKLIEANPGSTVSAEAQRAAYRRQARLLIEDDRVVDALALAVRMGAQGLPGSDESIGAFLFHERDIAAWLLARGGKLDVRATDGSSVTCRAPHELPDEIDAVAGIDLYMLAADEYPSATELQLLEHLNGLGTIQLGRHPGTAEELGPLIATLTNLKTLHSLYLNHTKVTVAQLQPMTRHAGLRKLVIYGTPAAGDASLPRLRAQLSRCALIASHGEQATLALLNNGAKEVVVRTEAGELVSLDNPNNLPCEAFSPIAATLDPTRPLVGYVMRDQLPAAGSLEALDLSGHPDVTDDAVEWLTRIGTLKRLNVSHTALSPAAVEELRRTLPDCEVKFQEQ